MPAVNIYDAALFGDAQRVAFFIQMDRYNLCSKQFGTLRTALTIAANKGRDSVVRLLLRSAMAEPQRALSLLKARALIDAAYAIPKVRTDARNEGFSPVGQRAKGLVVAPAYLEKRVNRWGQLPQVQVMEAQSSSNEELVACVTYALGLEGGGNVVVDDVEQTVGMKKEVFVELCELLVPKWARAEM